MRKILFRAWHKREQRMFKVYHLSWWYGIFLIGDKDSETSRRFGSGEVELMQFTGLLDKNGKEIFEGDIVQIENMYSERKVARVMWGKVSPMYTWMIGETWLLHFAHDVEGPIFPYCDRHNGYEVSIIGNIYENVELIPKDE